MNYINLPNLFDEEEFDNFLDEYWSQIFILNNDRNIVLASPDRETLIQAMVAVRKLKSYEGTPINSKMISDSLT